MRHLRFTGALAVVAAVTSIAAATAPASTTVVMSNLDNPRGLAFGPEGALYVAEAGRGGSGPCALIRGATQCYGATGAVSRLWRGTQTRVATGLPSYATAAGQATGPHDISLLGRGGAYVTTGLGLDPALRATLPGGVGVWGGFGRLVHVPASGNWRFVADLSAYEAVANPDGGIVESNPYGILALPGSRVFTDAGGNDLLQIRANGDISTLAVFPSRLGGGIESVPTSVVVGPDGAYYVGMLSGAPFLPGTAFVYRVVPGSAPEIYCAAAGGFKAIIDIAFGPDGNLYVLQFASGGPGLAPPGVIYRVASDCTRAVVPTGVPLIHPSSLAFGPDPALYVSNFGDSVGIGQVLRVEP